jgi:hypothetical protein
MSNGETYFGAIDKNASGQRLFGVNHAYWFVAFLKASCFVAIERSKPCGSLIRKQINEDEAKIVYVRVRFHDERYRNERVVLSVFT